MHQSNALITITQSLIGGKTVQAVSARDVHAFLEVSKAFTDWMPTQIKRGKFQEGVDYEVLHLQGTNPLGGRPRKDYMVNQRMAEHIGMMSGTEKGSQIRDWFQTQRDVAQGKANQRVMTPAEALLAQVQLIVEHERQIQTLQVQTQTLHTRVEAMETRAEEALQTLAAMPEPLVDPADLSTRAKVNRIVRDHCYKTNMRHSDAFDWLYREFRDRYGLDLVVRAKNRGLRPIEVAELEGQLENLYAVAYTIFGCAA